MEQTTKELRKTLDEKRKALASSRSEARKFEEVATCCNYLGHLYAQLGDHEKAFAEHKEELECYRKKNSTLDMAIAYRLLGERCADMGKFDQALKYQQKHLEMARKEKSTVETQRAWATLGRTYFVQYTSNPNPELLNTAEEAHLKALTLAEKLSETDQVKEREIGEMVCRACLNLGLVYDLKDDNEKCRVYFPRAIALAKRFKFMEELNRCENVLASIYMRIGSYVDALKLYNEAIQSGKALKDELVQYETLMNKAHVLLRLKDYESARHCFKKAHLKYERRGQEEEHLNQMIDGLNGRKSLHKTKKIISIVRSLQSERNVDKRIALCDRLGDLFVDLKCFSIAVEYYGEQLELAKGKGADPATLSIFYRSLGQTYLDNKQYTQALQHFQHELGCYSDDLGSEIGVRLRIIETNVQLGRNIETIIEEYQRLLIRCGSDLKLKIQVYEEFSQYLGETRDCDELYGEVLEEVNGQLKRLKERAKASGQLVEEAGEAANDGREEDEEQSDQDGGSSDLSDLTSDSDEDNGEEFGDRKTGTRKRKAALEKKQNEKGETVLHLACIAGDMDKVRKLIESGHRVNIRDNAGWLPIHEAANFGHTEILEFLIQHKASINDSGMKDCNGTTPLHDACTNGHLDTIEVLLRHNANVVAVDYWNQTPLDCLKKCFKELVSKKKLDEGEQVSYQEMIRVLKDRMEKRGYGVSGHKSQKRPHSVVLSDDDGHNQPSASCRRETNFAGKGSSSKNMRRNFDPSGDHFRSSKLPEMKKSLIDESEIVDDWLDDDLELNDKARTFVDLYEMKRVVDRAGPVSRTTPLSSSSKGKKRAKRSRDDDCEMLNEDDFIESNSRETSHRSHRKSSKQTEITDPTDYDILLDDDGLFVEPTPVKACLAVSRLTEPKKQQPEVIAQVTKVSEVASDLTADASRSSKIKIRVHIDQMLLLIPIVQKGSTVATLEKEVVDRYEKMRKIRPNISIITMDGALLSSDDLLEDVLIQNEVRAQIESYEIKSLNEVYRQECVHLEPINELELEFRMAMSSGTLNMRNSNLPNKSHCQVWVQTISMQNTIRILDLSYSNLLQLDSVSMKLIPTLATLNSLETLNLECTGLTSGQAKQLTATPFPATLTELNLNYNWLRGSTDSLVQLLKNQPNLQRLCLQFCDLTDQLAANLSFNRIVENRPNLRVQIDPFADFSSPRMSVEQRNLPEVCESFYVDFQRCLVCK